VWNKLIHDNPGFNTPSLSLGALVLYIFVVVGAVLWLRSLPPKNPARLAYRKRTATGLLIIAGLGVAQMITRMIKLDGIEWRLWSYLILLALVLYAAYAFWDSRTRLPAQMAVLGKTQRVDRAIGSRKPNAAGSSAGSSTSPTPSEPRPVATTGRREARRAKKRR
jgi:hypothetical protein